jgi:hypothetical protein
MQAQHIWREQRSGEDYGGTSLLLTGMFFINWKNCRLMRFRQAPARFDAAVRGVYHCYPRQMVVKKPMNLNDEDLVDGMSQDQKPLSWPTVMSYLLQRIRIAEIMRSLTDRNALTMSYAGDLSYNVISKQLLSLFANPNFALLSFPKTVSCSRLSIFEENTGLIHYSGD